MNTFKVLQFNVGQCYDEIADLTISMFRIAKMRLDSDWPEEIFCQQTSLPPCTISC